MYSLLWRLSIAGYLAFAALMLIGCAEGGRTSSNIVLQDDSPQFEGADFGSTDVLGSLGALSGGASVQPVPTTGCGKATTATTSIQNTNILWKPVSESDGNLVVLLSGSSVPAILCVAGRTGNYIGRTNPNRPTYRWTFPGSALPLNSILFVGGNPILVPNPALRYN